MEEKLNLTKTLEHLPLSGISVKEAYRIYDKTPDTGINESTTRAGIINPLMVIRKDDKYILIDGYHRYDFMTENYSGDTEVPTWIIRNELTDDEILMLILDIDRKKKKSYIDILAEYHLYDKLIPNNQGKSNTNSGRLKIIAERIGVSTSTINRLLKIDRIKPALIHAAANGIITLDKAMTDAKAILCERKKKDEYEDLDFESSGEETSEDFPESENKKMKSTQDSRRPITDKVIDLEAITTCCRGCNRTFDSLTCNDIPMVFNQKRQPSEEQTDWLK